MMSDPGVHIHQAQLQLLQLTIRGALTLCEPSQGQRFRLAVMENRPISVTAQQTVDAGPCARFAVLRQNEDGEIGRLRQVPAAVGTTGETQKAMEEIMAGIRVGFDVIQQHTWGIAQFR